MKILNSLILTFALFCVACGDNNGSTNVGNPDGNITTGQKIQMGKLVNGKSAITIPLGIFGQSEEDIGSSTIDIKVGSALRHDNVPAALYFNASKNAVAFTLQALKNGDLITFLITLDNGTLRSFEGNVSDTEDTEAVDLDAEEEDENESDANESGGVPQNLAGVYQCSSNCREMLICGNEVEAVADFEENLAKILLPFRVFQEGNHVHLNEPGDTSDQPDEWDEDLFNLDGNGVAQVDLDYEEFGPARSEGHCNARDCDIFQITLDFNEGQFTFSTRFIGVVSGFNRSCPTATFRRIRN